MTYADTTTFVYPWDTHTTPPRLTDTVRMPADTSMRALWNHHISPLSLSSVLTPCFA